jgi:hypothetical protein
MKEEYGMKIFYVCVTSRARAGEFIAEMGAMLFA